GKEDSDRLVKPQAFVVLKEPAGATAALADELKGFVRDKIAPYKYPRWIEFVAELPKTATGKIQRFKLRARRRATIGVWRHWTPRPSWRISGHAAGPRPARSFPQTPPARARGAPPRSGLP